MKIICNIIINHKLTNLKSINSITLTIAIRLFSSWMVLLTRVTFFSFEPSVFFFFRFSIYLIFSFFYVKLNVTMFAHYSTICTFFLWVAGLRKSRKTNERNSNRFHFNGWTILFFATQRSGNGRIPLNFSHPIMRWISFLKESIQCVENGMADMVKW